MAGPPPAPVEKFWAGQHSSPSAQRAGSAQGSPSLSLSKKLQQGVCGACRGRCLEGSCLSSPGVDDPHQHGRGVALADFNRDGKVDIVYGNWNGPHRLYLQMSAHGKVRFRVRGDLSLPPCPLPASTVSGPGISWGYSPASASHQAEKRLVALQNLEAGEPQ